MTSQKWRKKMMMIIIITEKAECMKAKFDVKILKKTKRKRE